MTGAKTEQMKIAMVVPPWFEVPPTGYGGIEWMSFWLTRGLVERGHEVTLIAAGRKHTDAKFHSTFDVPPSLRLGQALPEIIHATMASRVLDEIDVDVVHDHTLAGPAFARSRDAPTLVTAHGPMDGEILQYYRLLAHQISLVAISEAQRRAASELPWVATIHNAVPVFEYPFRSEKEDFVMFLGRMSPEKGAHLAIDAAKEAEFPIVVAAKRNEPAELEYFEKYVEPRLGSGVEWLGEVNAETKKDLLARARCLVFPIQWEEPFGIVMVEALACGTPVVALEGGSVPEVIDHGRTGLFTSDPAKLPILIEEVGAIDPAECRRSAHQKFDVERMVSGYETAYRRVARSPVTGPTLEIEDPALETSA